MSPRLLRFAFNLTAMRFTSSTTENSAGHSASRLRAIRFQLDPIGSIFQRLSVSVTIRHPIDSSRIQLVRSARFASCVTNAEFMRQAALNVYNIFADFFLLFLTDRSRFCFRCCQRIVSTRIAADICFYNLAVHALRSV